MTSKLKTDGLETVSGSGTIALTNQLSGMTAASMPTGSVLQVVQGSTTTQVEGSFASEANLGLSASITPSSTSSKILIIVQAAGCGVRNASTWWKITLKRDSTKIHNFSSYLGINASVHEAYPNTTHLDSPSSTSAISYNVAGTRSSGSANCYFNLSAGGADAATSTITLMEIKG